MEDTLDWNDRPLMLARSRGNVAATCDPRRNLLLPAWVPWPPPEILQKLHRSRQERAFYNEDLAGVTGTLGYYCDLQSLHSEDALTWSVFGPVLHAPAEAREAFCRELLELIDIPPMSLSGLSIWLWRRIPHPDTLVPGGPELDFAILADSLVLFGEAKWLSKVCAGQGKGKDKDQIELRRDFLHRYGPAVFGPGKRFVVLGLGLRRDVCENGDEVMPGGMLHTRAASWREVCGLSSHPAGEELARYLEWKTHHSRLTRRRPD